MKYLFLTSSLLFSLLLSCKSGLDITQTKPYSNSINKESFLSIPITPGNKISALKIEGQKTRWNYDLTVPQIRKGDKAPLFIILHGGVGSKNYTKFSECLIAPGLKDAKGFIFSPSAAWRTWTLHYLEKRILDFIYLAKKHWPIDPNKIVLVGYSNGAIAGWKYAKDHSDIFSAMILMGSHCKVKEKLNIPIYVIQGTKDKLFPIRKVRKRISEAKKLGCNITFIEAEGKTHIKACEYKNTLKTSNLWLKNNV